MDTTRRPAAILILALWLFLLLGVIAHARTARAASPIGADQAPQVSVPGSAPLPAGASVSFVPPPLQPQPVPVQPFPLPVRAAPLIVDVQNASDQPLNLTRDSEGLTIAAPDGNGVEVAESAANGGSSIRIPGCVAIDGRVSQVSCGFGTHVPVGPSRYSLSVTLVSDNAGSMSAQLAAQGGVSLIGPGPAMTETGDVPAVTVVSSSDQPASVSWDGSNLTITAAPGLAGAVSAIQTAGAPRQRVEAACTPADERENAIVCPLTAIPPVTVTFSTVHPAPRGTLSLLYADTAGPGTLTLSSTGADVAPGGAAVSVTLTQNGSTFAGSGVLRPRGGLGSFLLAAALADSNGNGYLYEGELKTQDDRWSAQGLWLSESEPVSTGAWTAGDATPSATQPAFITIATVDATPIGAPPAPALPLGA